MADFEKASFSSDDRQIFQEIARDVKSNSKKYRIAGQWLDEYCSETSYWQRKEKELAELKGQEDILPEPVYKSILKKLEDTIAKNRLPALIIRFQEARDYWFEKYKNLPFIPYDAALHIILIVWLLTDPDAENAGVKITNLQENWVWEPVDDATKLKRSFASFLWEKLYSSDPKIKKVVEMAWSAIKINKEKKKEYRTIWVVITGTIIILGGIWTVIQLYDYFSNSDKKRSGNIAITEGQKSPAIISTGPNSPVTVNYGKAENAAGLIRIIPNVIDNNIISILNDLHQKQDLRKLTPLETGKEISETAPGTYFYVSCTYLNFKEKDRDEEIGSAKVDSLWYLGHFELQKHTNGNICLLGYVSSESVAKISGPIGKTDIDIVACAQPWREFNNIAVIPVSRVSKCTCREITITEDRSTRVLDLRIK